MDPEPGLAHGVGGVAAPQPSTQLRAQGEQAGLIAQYRWGTGAEDAAVTLSNFGPVVFATSWKSSRFEPKQGGILDCSGRNSGGHAYLIDAYYEDLTIPGLGKVGRAFGILSSWGVDWGLNARSYLLWNDAEDLLASNGEIGVPVTRRQLKRFGGV